METTQGKLKVPTVDKKRIVINEGKMNTDKDIFDDLVK